MVGDDDADDTLPNYEMYKAEGDLHLMKGLLAKAVDCYTKVCALLRQDRSHSMPVCYICMFPCLCVCIIIHEFVQVEGFR